MYGILLGSIDNTCMESGNMSGGTSALFSYSEVFGVEHVGASKLRWMAWWAGRSGVTGLLTSLIAILPGELSLYSS